MKNSRPLGKLIAIGGNEDKGTYPNPRTKKKYYLNFFELGILKRIVLESGHEDPRIEVITTASMIPEEVARVYISSFTMLNCNNVSVLDIRTREDALRPDYVERIRKADIVLMSGGNQSRLTTIFGATEFLAALRHRYQTTPNFVVAGTSAGAMGMSKTMIKGGSVPDALMKGAVKMGSGLGLIDNVIIDSHFVKRGRFGRLIEAVALHPKLIGIGLGEDTGMLITGGNQLETIGSNMVVIMDGHQLEHSNAAAAQKGEAISVENMLLHVLVQGNLYDVDERRFYPNLKLRQQAAESAIITANQPANEPMPVQ
ncbi:cyanophycinase [Hymenobacter lapidiphilus]|uniref:Cyanophycinase n=1 Tax=Hymenobacter lapidiphilus TaxID=2608003 RepID=A0A7Y7U748_9BACT|nr:cyanophycinase [Hymenobacter lapidiphilus]NVO33057.1 cyanophycinase [Hymenobacter lapidiphilus]